MGYLFGLFTVNALGETEFMIIAGLLGTILAFVAMHDFSHFKRRRDRTRE